MKFTDLFIRRPVVATVVNLIILLAGFQAFKTLNVRQYPRSDSAVVQVTTAYVGANADLVRGFITTPLERVIASADGIDYIESTSEQSLSTISVHLNLNYDTNAALTQIQAKIAQVRNDLPPEAEAPQVQIERTDDRFASMYISFYSNDLDQNQITDYMTRVIQPKLTSISGVQRADILGARTFAMRIWLKPDRLAALNVTPTEVNKALAANNYLSAIGATKGSMISVNLVANTNLQTVKEFRQLVLKQRGGSIIRLEDVADVSLGAENYNEDVRFDGKKATFMGIWVLPTANALDVIKKVQAAIPGLRANLPAGMFVDVPYDSTEYIRDALEEVTQTLLETLAIVIVVIFLFLGSFRSVLIPVVAIPISLIGALFLMLVFGFTLNLLTLLAIVLAVGLVVDDAIVVVENVERRIQGGETAWQAAIRGARELFGPIIAMTITLAAVYTPIGLQGGLTGTLFREFAFTLAGAVAVSGVVALTLSPMMSSKLLRPGSAERGYAGWINHRFDKLRNGYMNFLRVSLRFWPATVLLAILVSLLMVPFWLFSGHELAPKEDQGIIFGIVNTSPNSTLDQISLYTSEVYRVFSSFPETAHVFQITGANFGFGGLVTKPWSERSKSIDDIAGPVAQKLSVIPTVQVISTTPAPLPGGSNFPLEMIISSTAEPAEIAQFANQLVGKAFATPGVVYADTDLKFDQPQTEIVFDRDKVASLGLNLSQVGADLNTMLGGDYVNRFSIQGRSYKVIPQVKRADRLNADQLLDYYVTGPDDKMIKLSTFATLKTTVQPRSLNRFQQLNSARISALFFPPATLESVLTTLETEAKTLPKGYIVDYAGEARQLRVEGSKFLPTLLLAVVLIYLVLAAQFESFRDPFIILFGSVPLALAGSLLFAFLGKTTVNIYSEVGLITLVGLIAKNGILMVEFANHLQETGLSKLEAIIKGSATRLRPILMTSVATVAGHFPLILASGPGAASRNSIGWILVTGMVIGTAFTLLVVPAIYLLLAKEHRRDVRPEEDREIAPEIEPAMA